MIDKIGTFFKPTISKKKEENPRKNSSNSSSSQNSQSDDSSDQQTPKEYLLKREKMEEVINEINQHNYYLEKNLIFTISGEEKEVTRVTVVNGKTQKVIQNMSTQQVLKIHRQLTTQSAPSSKGHLINIKF